MFYVISLLLLFGNQSKPLDFATWDSYFVECQRLNQLPAHELSTEEKAELTLHQSLNYWMHELSLKTVNLGEKEQLDTHSDVDELEEILNRFEVEYPDWFTGLLRDAYINKHVCMFPKFISHFQSGEPPVFSEDSNIRMLRPNLREKCVIYGIPINPLSIQAGSEVAGCYSAELKCLALCDFSDRSVGDHLHFFDTNGLRWTQRMASFSPGHPYTGIGPSRCKLIITEKSVWLFYAGHFSFRIQGFSLVCGETEFLLDSNAFLNGN